MISLRMSSFTYGPIIAKPVVPAELASLVVPGSEVASAEGPYGKLLFQEIHAGDIKLLYNIYQVKEDLAIDFQFNPGNLQTHVALKNDSQYNVHGIGDFYLVEEQFNIADASNFEGTYFLEAGKEYRTLHIGFSAEFLDKLFPVFPYLAEWLTSEATRPRLLFEVHAWLSMQMKDVIDKILNCPYSGELQGYYRELKASELLCLVLTPHNGHITQSVRLSRRNIALIRESRQLLTKSFDRHITISAIAAQAGMNEFKLRAGFKQVFGISMFDYLVKTRMQVARELLLETDKPIKEIAILTGYATKQSFLNAFKKYFHDTPGSFRKN